MPSKTKPGIREIAEEAGVAIATAERVLNERGSVSEKTRIRVLDAAKRIGARRILPEPWHGIVPIEVILPANRSPFWIALDEAVRRVAASLPRHFSVSRTIVPENDFSALRSAILKPKHARRGLIIAADAAETIAPALRSVIERGEHVITIVTDIPDLVGHHFSGINNVSAGRTAAKVMLKSARQEGVFLAIPLHLRRLEHRQRLSGFEMIAGQSRAVVVEVTNEIPGRTAEVIRRTLRSHTVAGIYATGHDSAEIAEVMRGLDRRPVWITHEKSELHKEFMRADLLDFVLDQDPVGQARWALTKMAELCNAVGPDQLPLARRPEMRLFCSENFD